MDERRITGRLDRGSFVPLHQQLYSLLRERILNGGLHEGATIETERELQETLGVSRSTVRQALSRLESEGLLVRDRGHRPRVTAMPYVETLMGLRGFSEEMRQVGRVPQGRTLSVTRETVDDESLALALGLGAGAEVIRLWRVMYIDNRPAVVLVSRIPAVLGIEIDESFTGSLYDLLENRYGLKLREATETLEGGPCPADAAHLLELPVGAPVLIRRRLTYGERQVPVEYVEGVYHPARYKYRQHLRRQRSDARATQAEAGAALPPLPGTELPPSEDQ